MIDLVLRDESAFVAQDGHDNKLGLPEWRFGTIVLVLGGDGFYVSPQNSPEEA